MQSPYGVGVYEHTRIEKGQHALASSEILLLNGPNLNMLGSREPGVYGVLTLKDIEDRATAHAAQYEVGVRTVQSNHEGALIDAIHEARSWALGIVFNAGAYMHTSIALRDAISAIAIP